MRQPQRYPRRRTSVPRRGTPSRRGIPEEDASSTTRKQKTGRCHCLPGCCRCQRPGHGDSFTTYFPRVQKTVHTGLSLSQATIRVMDSFVKDVLERISSEAGCLAHQTKRTTVTWGEIQAAFCLLLPGTKGKLAMSEATRPLVSYTQRKGGRLCIP